MNSFGNLFRLTIFGESHGAAVGIVIDGCIPGIDITAGDFAEDMNRRKGGQSAGTTQRSEEDIPEFISGVFNGKTTGAPLTFLFRNKDVRSEDYEQQRMIPRPGHADFVAEKKFSGFNDFRGGGHFSGRLTVCLVAAGVVAKKIMQRLASNIKCSATLVELGGISDIDMAVNKAIEDKDSVGGIVECIAEGLPIGLGEPFFYSLESAISQIVFSVPAVKGIEFGAGFAAVRMKGSEHNDMLLDDTGKTQTNHSGGISGGLSNGNHMVFRVAIKPTSSTPKKQTSFNKETGRPEEFVVKGRHDLAIALRVPVVIEAVTSCVIVDMLLCNSKYKN